MNCKPGDLARIVAPGYRHNQWIVRVCYAAQKGFTTNPDGMLVYDGRVKPGDWLIESLMASEFFCIGPRRSRYCVAPDSHLRPLPGEETPQETLRELEAV